jgi:hypothetical protein
METLDFRTRERIVLFLGAAAAGFLAFDLLAAIAGHSLGSPGARLATVLLVLYLGGRVAGHAKTLQERDEHLGLARGAWIASPFLTLVLLIQVVSEHAMVQPIGLPWFPGGGTPQLTGWGRLELTADVAVFALFIVTCIAVWHANAHTLGSALGRIISALTILFALDLVAVIWSIVDLVPQWRMAAGLFVIAVFGTIVVATLRRIERLDEWEPPHAPASPTAPQPPPIASMRPQP